MTLQRDERFRHGGKRGAVAQCARFPLDQANVVLPVIERLIALEAAHDPRNLLAVGDHHQLGRIDAQAEDPVRVFGGNAVAIAVEVNQPRGGDSYRLFNIAIECPGVGHELELLVLQYVGNGEFRPLRMTHVLPC